ncbi:MAG: PAS domain S-box protein [Anaerolineae bacterium]|nr:PAS domain S-box protein [Anaerolineae bacterium]
MVRLKRGLTPPIFENDEEKTRKAAVLNSLQLMLIAVTILAALASIFVFAEKIGSLIVVACMGMVLIVSRSLMYRERMRAASLTIIIGIWVAVTALVTFAGGMKSIDVVHYLSLTIISGLLLGPAGAFAMAGLCAFAGLLMLLFPSPQLFPLPPIAGWINFVFSLFLVVSTLNIAMRNLQNALALSQKRLQEREQVEKALAENQKRLRQLLSVNPAVIYATKVVGGNLEPTFISENVRERLGYAPEEVLMNSKFWLDYAHPEDIEPTLARVQQVFETGYTTVEYRFKHHDGTYRWIHDEMQLAYDEQGRPLEIIGSWYDITTHKQMERETENLRTMMEAAFEQSSVPMVLISAPDMIIRIANTACREFLGVQDEPEYVGQSMHDLKQTWQDFDPEGNLVPITEMPLWLALHGVTTRNKEYCARRKDGQERWELVNAAPIYNKNAEMIAALLTFPDITEQKQAEAERERLMARIQEQARQVRQIMDTVPEGVLLLDAEWHILLANASGEQYLQTLAGVQIGDTLSHLGSCPITNLLAPPAHILWHEINVNAHRFQSIIRPIETGETAHGWLLILRDVTQQYEFEQRIQQQERLAAVGQLAAGIAHDFNNIMSTVVLYTQMSMRTEGVPARVRERLETIHQQALHATHLTQQILDFSRRAVFERHPLDLLPLIKEHVKVLQRTLPENIHVQLDYGSDDYTINGSPTSIQQVIMNLALNARDAMPLGGTLSLTLGRLQIEKSDRPPLPEMAPGDWIELTVNDSGTGIDPKMLPRIFDPFFTTKDPGKGTGLGLAQVHGIVGMHNGHIDVNSEIAHGTTFKLYLPAIGVASDSHENPIREYPSGEGQCILVVEDNLTTRQALVESLEMLNYRVEVAAEGKEALARLERSSPDSIALVLSDVLMPGMGGIELLQEMNRRGLQTPVILLTGHPLKSELENLQSQGIHLLASWLVKPADLNTLSEAITRAMSHRNQ